MDKLLVDVLYFPYSLVLFGLGGLILCIVPFVLIGAILASLYQSPEKMSNVNDQSTVMTNIVQGNQNTQLHHDSSQQQITTTVATPNTGVITYTNAAMVQPQQPVKHVMQNLTQPTRVQYVPAGSVAYIQQPQNKYVYAQPVQQQRNGSVNYKLAL